MLNVALTRLDRPEASRQLAQSLWLRVALFALVWSSVVVPPAGAAAADPDDDYVLPLVNQALESEKTGVERPWLNVETGSRGVIVVERTFYRDPRTPCRDYRRTIERGGAAPVTINGTGCRVGPERWSLDEDTPDPTAATAAPAPRAAAATPPPPPPEPEPEKRADPEASCPPVTAAPVPCGKPPAFVDYTLPTRTEL